MKALRAIEGRELLLVGMTASIIILDMENYLWKVLAVSGLETSQRIISNYLWCLKLSLFKFQ